MKLYKLCQYARTASTSYTVVKNVHAHTEEKTPSQQFSLLLTDKKEQRPTLPFFSPKHSKLPACYSRGMTQVFRIHRTPLERGCKGHHETPQEVSESAMLLLLKRCNACIQMTYFLHE